MGLSLFIFPQILVGHSLRSRDNFLQQVRERVFHNKSAIVRENILKSTTIVEKSFAL